MNASDYGRSITIPASAFERTPAEQRADERYAEAARSMGQAARFYQRRLARDLGMTTLPGARIYVGSRGGPMTLVQNPPEDLTVMMPGEQEYIDGCAFAEAVEKAGGSAP